MLIFKEYNGIHALRKDWNELIPEDSSAIYQTFSFNCILYAKVKLSPTNWIRRLRNDNKLTFVVAYEDGIAKCIAPLMVFNKPTKVIRMLGYNTNAGYLNFIYKESKYAELTIEYLKQKYPQHIIELKFIHETSALGALGEITEEFGNYAISLEEYDTWFAALSKSTRQNIRTSYNRMKTDGHTYSLDIYDMYSRELEKRISRVNDIYWRRRIKWTGKETEYSRHNRYVFPRKDVIYQSLRKKDNTILVILSIDNQEAAFFVGLRYENGICIPRLAIDMEFSRYSPGLVLINEYLKNIKFEGTYIFDLCRGEEGYKTTLSAKPTRSYIIKINPTEST